MHAKTRAPAAALFDPAVARVPRLSPHSLYAMRVVEGFLPVPPMPWPVPDLATLAKLRPYSGELAIN